MPCVRIFVLWIKDRGVFQLRKCSLKVEENGGKNVFEWASSGKVDIDPCDPFTDSDSYFKETILQGVELSIDPLDSLETLLCQCVEKHIGCTV